MEVLSAQESKLLLVNKPAAGMTDRETADTADLLREIAQTLAVVVVEFFFFQAEDGIRDHCVTGVQTCALPISLALTASSVSLAIRRAGRSEYRTAAARASGCRGTSGEPVSVATIVLASATRGSITLRYASASGPRVAPVASVERSSIAAVPSSKG